MFTDLEGYTALAHTDEAGALSLLEEQERLINPLLGTHLGRKVKSMGDGLLIEFPNVRDAVECAVEIQRSARERSSGASNPPLRIRVGIHLGDVEGRGDDILGDAVNIASRIEPLADAGGVCISGQVYDQIHNKLPYQLEKVGPQSLKGVNEPVDVYRIVLPGRNSEGASSKPGPARLAVLPFANISPDPKDDYFADGLTDELIGVVSRIPGLSVISRTSVMRYRGAAKRVGEIGQELRVRTVLEGSVRKDGNRVRVSAQLVDVSRDSTLWSEKFDRELRDVFAIQEEVSQQVARALKRQLAPTPSASSAVHGSRSTEAYTLYLRGRYFWNRGTKAWLEKALEEFEAAAKLDPAYGPAYAGIADSLLLLGRRGDVSPGQAYPKAVQSASHALRLEPELAEPHAALGSIRQEYEWKWAESEAEFRHALELNPSYSTAHSWYALFLGHVGRFAEALAEAAIARELDPLSHRIHTGAAEEFIFARQYDDAIGAARRALELEPSFGPAHAYIAEALVEQGDPDHAVTEFEEAGRLLGAQAWLGRLGHAQALSGRKSEALHVIRQLEEGFASATPGNPFLSPTPYASLDIGLVHLGLGERESALDWFERARDDRVPEVVHFKSEPIYDPVRSELRFRTILKSIGLTD